LAIVFLILIIFAKIFSSKTGYAKIQSKQIEKILKTVNQSVLSLIPTGNVKVVIRSKASEKEFFVGNFGSGDVKK
jgi:rRNA pseudouridine-1189 N-methylase Emg1 (Nep1/Mra1 family)